MLPSGAKNGANAAQKRPIRYNAAMNVTSRTPLPPRLTAKQGLGLLKDLLQALMPESGDYPTPVPGLTLYRRHREDAEHRPVIYDPELIIIAQGEKHVRLGAESFSFGEGSAFVTGVDIPTACALRRVSPERPFLSLVVTLDRALLAELIAADIPPAPGMAPEAAGRTRRGIMVEALDGDLLDAALRLTELAARPEAAPTLAPLFTREIHFRLLTGPFGPGLRALGAAGSPGDRMARVIRLLREEFDKPLAVPELARQAGMSETSFYKHFKRITGMSPLSFQKRLRLDQAQRLMLGRELNASEAALAVGYESLQQFSREYKRLFGAPPRRDIMRRKRGGE